MSSRIHHLEQQERAALQQAYDHKRSEVAAWSHTLEAWTTLEVLARKGLLHFHRIVHAPEGQARVYRITTEGRATLHPKVDA